MLFRSASLLTVVNTALSAETIRPVGDRLTVQSAEIITYEIEATLYLYPGPESEPIITAAQNALSSWLSAQGKIGTDVARSAIMAALHVQGVQRVEVASPSADIVISDTQSALCSSYRIDLGGTNE